jgi:CheY-like chemotaxis protein
VSNNIEFVRVEAGQGLSSEARQALLEALDGVRRIQTIVGDLKAFAKPEANRAERVDVRATIATALKMAEGQTRGRAQVVTELLGAPVIVASETRIVQLLLNLVVNAAHAIPDGPPEDQRITVRARSEGARVLIEVEDTGVGIPEESLAHVGEPFFTTKDEGLGLGLAVCHHIVTSTGGELRFSSRPGCTVAHVLLPLAPSEEPDAGADDRDLVPAAVSPVGDRLRVLVVDDDALVARAMARHLRGHDVRVCAGGREALALLEEGERYDLFLCDLMMPDLTGIDVFHTVERLYPEIASDVVFMTGGTFTERAQTFREQSRNAFLEKPIDLGRLSRLVRERAARLGIEPSGPSEAQKNAATPSETAGSPARAVTARKSLETM